MEGLYIVLFVATDDERIANCCRGFGADVIMTSESCQNGKASPDAVFSTAVTSLKAEDASDPSRVKCLSDKVNPQFAYLLHLGIQSYEAKFLKLYPELSPTPLQLEEDLVQLKVLENVVATDDERTANCCRGLGADGLNASCSEAHLNLNKKFDIVVNIQGDEPLIEPEIIDWVVNALQASPDAVFSTTVTSLKAEGASDPNRVKCLVDNRVYAIYFSRGIIPFIKSGKVNPQFPYLPSRHPVKDQIDKETHA
ncbi:hypothetical protein CTI12_AA025250 [Artemisia annua]|uniref:Uncharacterized protein n=1 Tax=Artemisia annua TaxID=35608 RepID=A0A2U1QIR4_ARTAN|nr:hypothetical protein CTI12_AA025250 [Artemisia annua]